MYAVREGILRRALIGLQLLRKIKSRILALDWRSPHNGLATRLVLIVWLASLSIFLPGAFADHATDYSIKLQSYGYDAENDLSTYTWVLTSNGDGGGVSPVVINTCLGNAASETRGDPDGSASAGSTGYKWELDGQDLPVGSTFVLKFTGEHGDSGTASWTLKKGPEGHEKNGTTDGPRCVLEPSVTTTSSEQGTISPGTEVTDHVEVTGGKGTPTGEVTFYLCGPDGVTNGCTNESNQIGQRKTITGGKATSDSTSPTEPGRYCWRAKYSGDDTYESDSHTNDTTECFEVGEQETVKQNPEISTESEPNGEVEPGGSVTGAAMVTAGTGLQPADHATDYSIELQSYSYDAGNNLSIYTWELTSDGDQDGVSHVIIDTCLGNTAVSTGGSPDGSAEYKNPDPSTGSTGYKWEVGGDLPVGSTFILKFTGEHGDSGTASWTIKKGPDGHEKDGTTDGPSCLLDPSMTTASSEQGTVSPGTEVTDLVEVKGGGGTPTGEVTFYLCGPGGVTNGCTSETNQIGQPKTLSGGKATSDSTSPTVPGRYCWLAKYSGDDTYESDSHTNDTTECFSVGETVVLGTQVLAHSSGGGAGGDQLPGTGPNIPLLPALLLALDFIMIGFILKKLEVLPES